MKEYVAQNRVAPDASSGVARKARNVIVSYERRAIRLCRHTRRLATRGGRGVRPYTRNGGLQTAENR